MVMIPVYDRKVVSLGTGPANVPKGTPEAFGSQIGLAQQQFGRAVASTAEAIGSGISEAGAKLQGQQEQQNAITAQIGMSNYQTDVSEFANKTVQQTDPAQAGTIPQTVSDYGNKVWQEKYSSQFTGRYAGQGNAHRVEFDNSMKLRMEEHSFKLAVDGTSNRILSAADEQSARLANNPDYLPLAAQDMRRLVEEVDNGTIPQWQKDNVKKDIATRFYNGIMAGYAQRAKANPLDQSTLDAAAKAQAELPALIPQLLGIGGAGATPAQQGAPPGTVPLPTARPGQPASSPPRPGLPALPAPAGTKGPLGYAPGMGYNRFGDPTKIDAAHRAAIEQAAKAQGYSSVVFFPSGDNPAAQRKAAQEFAKQGGKDVLEFSAGVYNLKNQAGINHIRIGAPDMPGNTNYAGSHIDQPLAWAKAQAGVQGAVGAPGTPGAAGAKPPTAKASSLGMTQGGVPAILAAYIVKKENFSKTPFPDGANNGIGYGQTAGTRTSANEPEEFAKLETDLSGSLSRIQKLNPNVPTGAAIALASLDNNAGWTRGERPKDQAMIAAVKAGDWNAAKQLFTQFAIGRNGVRYNGLMTRRQEEMAAFDNPNALLGATSAAENFGGNMSPEAQARYKQLVGQTVGDKPASPEVGASTIHQPKDTSASASYGAGQADLAFFAARGGKPDASVPMNPVFLGRLQKIIQAAEAATGSQIHIRSMSRSTARQAAIYEDSGHGTRYMAAPPGHSYHETGAAVDIDRSPALTWIRAHTAEFGLGHLSMNDEGHIQLPGAGPSGGSVPAPGDGTGGGYSPITTGTNQAHYIRVAPPPFVPGQTTMAGIMGPDFLKQQDHWSNQLEAIAAGRDQHLGEVRSQINLALTNERESMRAGGDAHPQITPDLMRNAGMSEVQINEVQARREADTRFYAATSGLEKLPLSEAGARVEALNPAHDGMGQNGFAYRQKNYEDAQAHLAQMQVGADKQQKAMAGEIMRQASVAALPNELRPPEVPALTAGKVQEFLSSPAAQLLSAENIAHLQKLVETKGVATSPEASQWIAQHVLDMDPADFQQGLRELLDNNQLNPDDYSKFLLKNAETAKQSGPEAPYKATIGHIKNVLDPGQMMMPGANGIFRQAQEGAVWAFDGRVRDYKETHDGRMPNGTDMAKWAIEAITSAQTVAAGSVRSAMVASRYLRNADGSQAGRNDVTAEMVDAAKAQLAEDVRTGAISAPALVEETNNLHDWEQVTKTLPLPPGVTPPKLSPKSLLPPTAAPAAPAPAAPAAPAKPRESAWPAIQEWLKGVFSGSKPAPDTPATAAPGTPPVAPATSGKSSSLETRYCGTVDGAAFQCGRRSGAGNHSDCRPGRFSGGDRGRQRRGDAHPERRGQFRYRRPRLPQGSAHPRHAAAAYGRSDPAAGEGHTVRTAAVPARGARCRPVVKGHP